MSDQVIEVKLTVAEIKELLYWHSETPDPGNPDEPEKEALKQKLWDLLPYEDE